MRIITKIAAVAVAGSLAAGAGAGALAMSGKKSPRLSKRSTPVVQTSTTVTGVLAGGRVPRATDGSIDTTVLHRPGERVTPGADTGNWSSMFEFMKYVIDDTAAVWNWYYARWWGANARSSVRYNFMAPGQSVRTACGDVTDDSTAEYCGLDDTIYVSQARAAWYWRNAGGDFGVAAMLAHEYGHNVQRELGIRSTVPKMEMHSDCLSGAFARIAYYQGILDANDIREGVASRNLVGDTNVNDPQHHGTSEQRMAAFLLGYNSEGPNGCDRILQG